MREEPDLSEKLKEHFKEWDGTFRHSRKNEKNEEEEKIFGFDN
jgi:hypothetical protein